MVIACVQSDLVKKYMFVSSRKTAAGRQELEVLSICKYSSF